MQSGSINRRTVEDMRQDIADLRAKLELNLATNPGVIEQYERREKEVCGFGSAVL